MLGPTSQSYSVEVERDTDLSLTAEVEKTGWQEQNLVTAHEPSWTYHWGSKEGGVEDSGVDGQTKDMSSGGQRENSPKPHQRPGCEQREKGAGRGLGRGSATNKLGVKA